MKTIIAAIFALTATVGFAQAQEAPQLIGNLSDNVRAMYNGNTKVTTRTNRKAAKASRDSRKRQRIGLQTADPAPYTGR